MNPEIAKELTVILKDSERVVRHKFLLFNDFTVHPENEMIKKCIDEATRSFPGNPEDIDIKIHMTVR